MSAGVAETARGYAAAGWPIVPLVTGSKRPRIKTGADHAGAATCDLERVGEWWSRWPDAGIGIVCARGGFVVIDVDGPEGLRAFRAHPGPFPLTTFAVSGRETGGFHGYYRLPPGAQVPRGRVLVPGLELKGAGNLVVAPPSLHPSGRRYRWEVPPPFMADGRFPVTPQPAAPWMLDSVMPASPPVAPATVALGEHHYTREGARRMDAVLSFLEQGESARHLRFSWAAGVARELVGAGHLSADFARDELRRTAVAVWRGEDDPGEIDGVLKWAGLGGQA